VKSSGESIAPKETPIKGPEGEPIPPGIANTLNLPQQAPKQPEYIYQEVENPKPVEVPKGPPPVYVNHEVFGRILQHYVTKSGWVDYRGLQKDKDAVAELDAYVKDLSDLNPSTLPDDKDKLASWLNLYNAMVMRDILKFYPVENLLKIPNFFGTPRFKVGGKDYSLLDIEELFFRQDLKEPRTVFARVNGATSGPRMLREPFDPRKIDAQLEERTKAFLTDPANMQYNAKNKMLLLNATLLFYEKDFADLPGFLANYLSGMAPNYQYSFFGYDWKLNDSKLH